MGRQKIIHFNSNKQGQEFITAMAENAEYNELVIQHPASGEGETALWTLENVNGQKTPVMFPNDGAVKEMVEEETERAISAETILRESIDSIVMVKVDPSQLEPNEKEAYELQVDGVTKGEKISVYKDSSLYGVYIGHVDDRLVSEDDPTVIDGTGDTALCLIYYTVAGTYQLVTINIETFIEENEFKDGLQVVNHQVSVLINPNSDEYLTVDADGILLTGVTDKFNELNEKIKLENLRALSAETMLAEALDAEVERAKDAETVLHDDIEAETERAMSAETLLAEAIEEENERALAAEQALNNKIEDETERAQSAETVLDNKIEEESERAMEAEQHLAEELDAEIERAIAAEEAIDVKLDNEIERAQSAETVLNEEIVAENERALAAEQALDEKIDAETVRAESAETVLNEELAAESVRAQSAEEALDNKIESIELVRLPDTGYSSNERDVYELQIDGVKHGDNVVVYKDSSLKYVYLGHVDDRLVSEDSSDVIQGTGDTALCFIYFTVDGIYQLVAVNVESFLQESEFGQGLEVVNHEVKVKIDSTSEMREGFNYLTVSENGLKIQGIQNTVSAMGQTIETKCEMSAQTLNNAITAETQARENADAELQNNINELSGSTETVEGNLAAEIERATSAETVLNEVINDENERALAAEQALSDAIDVEEQRATDAEEAINTRIDTLKIDCGEF